MTGMGAHQGGAGDGHEVGASWRALSGETHAPAPTHDAHAAAAAHQAELPMQPVAGNWTQPWQDEHGQWHYPFAHQQPLEQPPYPHAAGALAEPQPVLEPQPTTQPQPFVAPEQLEPVGPPRYHAPQRVVRDPRQRTMAAVITFVALVVGLWGMLGFMGEMSKTLSSVNSGNAKLKLQLVEANKGLVSLDEKTRPLHDMAENTTVLGELLGTIDSDMGTMLTGVDSIATGMEQLGGSLDTLDSDLGQVNDINAGMSTQLGSINTGLKQQVAKVRTMRKDVQSTGVVLGSLPGRLSATNARLAHVNGAVDVMGCRGVMNELAVKISLGPIPNGSAKVYATVIPPAAWGKNPDGSPCTP